MSILFKGGQIVSATTMHPADLRIEGEKIVEIGEHLPENDSNVVDVSGCLLFPGFIDAHTHLDMATAVTHTADNFSTGSTAAIAGGTTCVIDFATQERDETLQQGLENWHALADGKSACDYAFHMSITNWNEHTASEIPAMFKQGISSFKLYMAYDNLRIRDAEIFEIMETIRDHHGMLGCHCENGDLVDELIAKERRQGHLSPAAHPHSRPDSVETEAVERYLTMAKLADLPVNIVHLSCLRSLEAVRRRRGEGQKIFVETCPHYLLLDDSYYELPDFESAKYVCSPPLRGAGNPPMLWDAITAGEINTISTDHCSFNFEGQKTMGRDDFSKIPNGLPGVEHRPILIYTYGVCEGRITYSEMAGLLSENIARQFGMYPQKGTLSVGSDADIVVWDPIPRGTIRAADQHHHVDYTPYEGFQTQGTARQVYLRGQLAAEGGHVFDSKRGHFVHCGSSEW